MNGTNNGNRPEDMRSIAEEERTDSRDNGRQERTIGEIISDATDEELKHYHTGTLTPEELRSAVDKERRAGRRRMLRRLTAAAALLMLVVAATVFAFENFTTDVDADKNAKEEIVTEDGVVIEDGGWGGTYEQSWEVTDWNEIPAVKATVPQLIVPEYIPEGYKFHVLSIYKLEQVTNVEYVFSNEAQEILYIQEYIHNTNLESIYIKRDEYIESSKGKIYLEKAPNGNNAVIYLNDDITVSIWTILNDGEIIEIINNLVF